MKKFVRRIDNLTVKIFRLREQTCIEKSTAKMKVLPVLNL